MAPKTTRLRALLAQRDIILAPGVFDALSARLAVKAGFEALYMGGMPACNVRLGMPDMGLMTMTEMIDSAGRIADAADLPVITDADTGYGSPLNIQRTVRGFEKAGVAAMHIEDQVDPKRCGLFEGKQLVPATEMVTKIKAALDARTDPDFMIIARTDAISVEGFDQACERAAIYEEAGADALFIIPPLSEAQAREVGQRFRVPLIFHRDTSGRTQDLPVSELSTIGFKIVVYPTAALFASIAAVRRLLDQVKETGSVQSGNIELGTFGDIDEIVDTATFKDAERRFST